MSFKKIHLAAITATIVIQVILLIVAGHYRGQYINGYDGTGYYAWVRSAVFDRDVNFHNEFTMYNPNSSSPDPDYVFPKTKFTYNQYSAGFPFLCSPGFLIGHTISLVGPESWRKDGYGTTHQLGYVVSGFLWYSFGLFLLYFFLIKRFDPLCSLAMTLVAAWGTTAGYYAWSEPFFSHAVDFFTVMLWMYWVYSTPSTHARHMILGGLIAALMMWVRLDNGIFILLIFPLLLELIKNNKWSPAGLFMLSLIVGLIPHYTLRYLISGEFSFISGYSSSDYIVEGHTFSNLLSPNVHKVLFATNNGLIFWCPILLFGLIGLIHFWRKKHKMLVLAIVIKIYLVSAWLAWDGSASMGPRTLTGLLPGLIWISAYDLSRTKFHSRFIFTCCLISCFWFTGLVYQRFSNQLPYYENFHNLRDYPYKRVFIYQFTNLKDLITNPKKIIRRLKD